MKNLTKRSQNNMASSTATTSSGKYDKAIKAMAKDAIKHINQNTNRTLIGFGSGRAASAVAKEIAQLVKDNKQHIIGVPTSLQIKLVIEKEVGDMLPLIEADQTDKLDIVFDGADQIDAKGYVVKGGGGALLRENILFNMAAKVIVMADATKFVQHITRSIPVEIHHLARRLVQKNITNMGGKAVLRIQNSGYPVFTENKNIILDCSFNTIVNPKKLTYTIKQIPGVIESGIFTKRPDIIYKAETRGKFKEIKLSNKKHTL